MLEEAYTSEHWIVRIYKVDIHPVHWIVRIYKVDIYPVHWIVGIYKVDIHPVHWVVRRIYEVDIYTQYTG